MAPRATPWRAAATQVLVEDVDDPRLAPDDLHHLSRVLRLRAGEVVCATDGRGGWHLTTFTGAEALSPTGESGVEPAPAPALTVGFALVKGERPELVVQKLTELGVDHIVPFTARRSVVRWDEARTAKQLERLRRVAREACAQSRRLHLPTVGGIDGGLGGAPDRLPTLSQLRDAGAVLAHAGGRALRRSDTIVLVGPEGGWDPDELDGADHVAVGDNVLRAETAAIAVGVTLTALRVGLVDEGLESSP
ncbi:MAG: RsmE family RNA methyltransferase [Microthrixaceae bacterium]